MSDLSTMMADQFFATQPRLLQLAARNVSPQVAAATLARLDPMTTVPDAFVESVEATRAAMPEDRTLPFPDEHYLSELVEMGVDRASAAAMFALGKEARLHGDA